MKENKCFFCGSEEIIVKDIILLVNDSEADIGIGKKIHVCHVCWNQTFRCRDGLKVDDEKEKVNQLKQEFKNYFK